MARLFAVDEDGIVSVSSVAAAIQVVKVDDAWVMFVGGGVYGLSATLIGDDLTERMDVGLFNLALHTELREIDPHGVEVEFGDFVSSVLRRYALMVET